MRVTSPVLLMRVLAFAAIFITLASAAPASAQPLRVPLTGRRVRPIDTDALFHTLFADFFREPDGTTYVQTGDIPAMWQRDSSAQTLPYLRFAAAYPALRARFEGVIERQARNIQTDPYANAFMASYHVWERKWEVDSLAWPLILAYVYYERTGDRSIFTRSLHDAMRTVVATYRCEQHHATCRSYAYPYRVITHDAYNPNTGLIWSAFRPSDDPVAYRFNIPQNALAVVGLRDLAVLARTGYADERLAGRATQIAAQVQIGIARYGRVFMPKLGGWVYVYETDGDGGEKLMDDANIPNLTALPYVGWCSSVDTTYLRTRAFVLSSNDPYYFRGTYATGLGSQHTPTNFVWPLGLIGRALTATSSIEVAQAITTLAETDGTDGLIHESFYDGGYWRYTRAEFGWANAMYAELLFRSVAGFRAIPFVTGGTVLPFQQPVETPTLVPAIVQIENTGDILTALGRLLANEPSTF